MNHAHRPDPHAALRRIVWWALIAVLLVAIAIAWTAVDHRQLVAWAIEGYR